MLLMGVDVMFEKTLHNAAGDTRRVWRLLPVGLMALVIAGLLSVAHATIPDSEGKIDACYRDATGELRVVDTESSEVCLQDESPLSWAGFGDPQVVTKQISVSPSSANNSQAECPSGTRIVSGGHSYTFTATDVQIITSFPGLAPPFGNYATDRWSVAARNNGASQITLTIYALCVAGGN